VIIWVIKWLVVCVILYVMVAWTGRRAYRKGFDRAKAIALREIEGFVKKQS